MVAFLIPPLSKGVGIGGDHPSKPHGLSIVSFEEVEKEEHQHPIDKSLVLR